MKRCVMLWTLTAVLATCSAVLAADALSAGEKLAVETLIKQFSLRSFADRQKATEKLIELGPKVLPVVEQALAETNDNEVKLRCRMVMDSIAKKYGVKVAGEGEAPVPPDKFGLDAAKVTLKVTNADLAEVLQALADKSGNRIIPVPDAWEGPTITLDVADMPYWETLDAVLKQAKLAPDVDRRTGDIRLVSAEKPSEINAYTGPVVVRAESATKRRTFTGADARTPRDGLFYQLTYAWEDRIKPLRTDVTVTRAVTVDGAALKLDETPAFRGMGRTGGAAGTVTVGFVDVPAKLERIATLEGTVKMTFGAGKKQVKINDVFGEGERKVVDGDATLAVTRANRGRGGAFVALTQTVNGEETPMPNFPASSEYGFTLVAPDGKEYKSSVGFGGGFGGPGGGLQRGPGGGPGAPADGQPQDNGGRRNRRNRGGNQDNPGNQNNVKLENDPVEGVIIEVQNVPPPDDQNNNPGRGGRRGGPRGGQPGAQPGGRPGGGGAFAMFRNLPDVEGQWTLVYTKPLKETEKSFTFTLKDVPLP